MKQDVIKEMFDGKEHKGITLHYNKKQGMSLIFDLDNPEGKSADDIKGIIKSAMKADPVLKVLMVTIEVN